MFMGRGCAMKQEYNYDNVSGVSFDWVAKGAKGLYCRGSGAVRYYEYICDESAFLEFAKSVNATVRRASVSDSVISYKHWELLRIQKRDFDSLSESEQLDLKRNTNNGLFAEIRRENGSGFTMIYDNETGNCYTSWAAW
jgi:hypothetical protein